MNLRKAIILAMLWGIWANEIQAQTTTHLTVDAATSIGEITPLWNDYWELNIQHGYGLNPAWFPNAPHTPFAQDSGFLPGKQ